eukprot:4637310-Prymnesium_polylepis.1
MCHAHGDALRVAWACGTSDRRRSRGMRILPTCQQFGLSPSLGVAAWPARALRASSSPAAAMQMLAFFNPLTSPPDEEDEEEGARPVPRRGAQPQRPHNGLHDAALWNNTSKMKKYLDSGAATVNDFAIGTQQTALMWAAQEGHAEAVQLLLSYGARPSVKDETGRTALEIAKRQNHGMVENILIEEEKRLK